MATGGAVADRPFRPRGDWAGIKIIGTRKDEEEALRFHAKRVALRKQVAQLREEARSAGASAANAQLQQGSARNTAALHRRHLREIERDMVNAAAHFRAAQAIASAYPAEKKSEGDLLVARYARDVRLLEDHADYLRAQLEVVDGQDRAETERRQALQARADAAAAQLAVAREQLRLAGEGFRREACWRVLWREGWPGPRGGGMCGEQCTCQGRRAR
ncbi:unnamed protein product [Pedinophyceae sp. YPF-701]|nr:unnamed protein product [Pedinophyceae sp. YPF-701]